MKKYTGTVTSLRSKNARGNFKLTGSDRDERIFYGNAKALESLKEGQQVTVFGTERVSRDIVEAAQVFEHDPGSEAACKAHALFETKSVEIQKADGQEFATITGTATTPTPDRYGDIVESSGAVFKLPLPLLWQHAGRQPVGNVTEAAISMTGIDVVSKIPLTAQSKTLRERIEEAVESARLGLVRGLSIGFSPITWELLKDTFGFHFTEWEWLELSLVTIPANAEATIQTVKAYDVAYKKEGAGAIVEPSREVVVRLDAESKARARAALDQERRSAPVFLK